MPKVTTLGKREKRRILKEHRGILARVQRKCEVSQQAVSRVFWGQGRSARIEDAIDHELSAIEKSVEQPA